MHDLNSFDSRKQAYILHTHALEAIQAQAREWPPQSLILIDIDDTVITPLSHTFRWDSPGRFLIDHLKQKRQSLKDFETILSTWRLQRKIQLVDAGWPAFIQEMRAAQHSIYALTHLDTGPFGLIPSMELWRYKELQSLGILFSPSFQEHDHWVLPALPQSATQKKLPGIFYKGLFLTGSLEKRAVLRWILEKTKTVPELIAVVDDRADQIEALKKESLRQGAVYRGFIYKGIEGIHGAWSVDRIQKQKDILLQEHRWVEDSDL